jgi:dihydropteroate synthase
MFTLNCKGRLLVVDKPLVMGIINATPDSFYAGSRFTITDDTVKQAEQMLKDGATILDIGGQSTRPGSDKISADEELQRIIKPIEAIHQQFPDAFISVDTYYAKVAQEAVAAGACIVNDISAGSMDAGMITTVAALHVPYVLMHMQGTPQTMQQQPTYTDVAKEVLDFFIERVDTIHQQGITDIILDPGFGFGKTINHNFELLNKLDIFSILHCPVLLGVSRKSFIYKTLGITANESLNGTTISNTIGLMKGATILRVHDVREAVQAIAMTEKIAAQY